MIKVRKEFLYALFATLQVGGVYCFLVAMYKIGEHLEPTTKWWNQLGLGFLIVLGLAFVVAACIGIGFVLYEWGKWSWKIAGKYHRKVERYFRRRELRQVITRSRREMERDNRRWEV